jgi:hypothetical protein
MDQSISNKHNFPNFFPERSSLMRIFCDCIDLKYFYDTKMKRELENGGKVEKRKMEGRRVEGKQEIGGGNRGYGGGRGE